jgi:FkbM family methyltransferase
MKLRTKIKQGVKRLLAIAGLEIRRLSRHETGTLLTLDCALSRLKKNAIQTIIDVGASDGRWSAVTMNYFPEASFFLIEAQRVPHEIKLKEFCRKHQNVSYLISAAGDAEGKINFYAGDPLGGHASREQFGEHNLEVPMTTIDDQVELRKLEPPFLIKLDVHGFEIAILNGAERTLQNTNVLIIEAYNFKLCDGCLRFHELCSYMEKLGFRCSDLFDPLHRPVDGLLWQMDLVFVKSTRAEFLHDAFSY